MKHRPERAGVAAVDSQVLLLSVARDAITLWDSELGRSVGVMRGEVMVNLPLTADQQEYIVSAKRASTVVRKTGARVFEFSE